MKKQANFNWMTNTLAALACILTIFATACENPVTEDPIEEPPLTEETVYPDSIYDLVAYFDAELETFFIDPAYLELVLDFFGATPSTDGGFYTMMELNQWGEFVEYKFAVVQVPIPEVFYIANEREIELQDSGTDDNGVRYKTYRHAKCDSGTNQGLENGDCENLPQIDEETEAASFKSKVEERYNKCEYDRQENNLCTERLKAVGYTYYYDELDCDGDEVEKVPYKRYRCD